MAAKSPDAFRTISEVADWLDVPAHVLRFWESKFPQIKPVKRAGGRRYYRPSDMELIGGIKRLLHDDGMTIRGVQRMLKENGVKSVVAMAPALNLDVAEAVEAAPAPEASKPAPRAEPPTAAAEEDTDADDNVVPMSRRERRRLRLEERASDSTDDMEVQEHAEEADTPQEPDLFARASSAAKRSDTPAPPAADPEPAAPAPSSDQTPPDDPAQVTLSATRRDQLAAVKSLRKSDLKTLRALPDLPGIHERAKALRARLSGDN